MPCIAPKKVGIYTVVNNIPYQTPIALLCEECVEKNLAFLEDTGKASIGKKYSRGDEIGIPFAISIDSDTIDKNLVTIRERDSCEQIQLPLQEAIPVISQLCCGTQWETITTRYPRFLATPTAK
uniref:Glycine--tRNA ligase n=1 Tax=Lygus hesperus TaxID=30085 RepID=A0A0A9WNH8_LYGHE